MKVDRLSLGRIKLEVSSPCVFSFLYMNERRQKFITKIDANLVFRACVLFSKCFRTPGAQ